MRKGSKAEIEEILFPLKRINCRDTGEEGKRRRDKQRETGEDTNI